MPSWFGSKKNNPAPQEDPITIVGEDADQQSRDSGNGEHFSGDTKEKITVAPHETLSDEAAAKRLKIFKQHALHDPNLGNDDIDAIEGAVDSHNVGKENILVNELIDDSPYPEVRTDIYLP